MILYCIHIQKPNFRFSDRLKLHQLRLQVPYRAMVQVQVAVTQRKARYVPNQEHPPSFPMTTCQRCPSSLLCWENNLFEFPFSDNLSQFSAKPINFARKKVETQAAEPQARAVQPKPDVASGSGGGGRGRGDAGHRDKKRPQRGGNARPRDIVAFGGGAYNHGTLIVI